MAEEKTFDPGKGYTPPTRHIVYRCPVDGTQWAVYFDTNVKESDRDKCPNCGKASRKLSQDDGVFNTEGVTIV